MINFSVQTLFDNTESVLKSLTEGINIFVGIPEENAKREDDKEMNNATLLYIHTNGSPVKNIPARPVIEPALTVADNKEKIASDLKQIMELTIDGKDSEALLKAEKTGQRAVNMVKKWFVDPRNGWAPNAPATVWRKIRKTGKDLKERMEIFQQYLSGEEGINTVLVDTAEMRNSITYIVEEK